MHNIKIHSGKKIISGQIENGKMLLDYLREKGFEIYSPCGGNGTCGKCGIFIKGFGEVMSCMCRVEEDMEIIIPDRKEVKILSAQYENSVRIPFRPGADLLKYPFPLGIALDLGTTTMVFYLMNLTSGAVVKVRSLLNPQVKYGSDVISRINYSLNHEHGLKVLQDEIIRVINEVIDSFAESESVTPDEIVRITVTGNTIMLHIVAGVNPAPLAFVPFKPVFTDTRIIPAHELGIRCNPEGEVRLLPSLSAYLGADVLAGLCTLKPPHHIRNYLFLDIGTNGEMGLVNQEEVYFCSTAAGPAFEGANISCGTGGIEGAISAYGQHGYSTIGDALPIGICGSGLLDLVAFLLDKDLISPDGYMAQEFLIAPEHKTATGKSIVLKPSDVRELQLAKAAIAAGINLLLREARIPPGKIDAIFLAGGFGNFLNVKSALRIGLIPEPLKNKIIPVGNTSGTGAVLSLRSDTFNLMIDQLKGKAKYLDLSQIGSFTEEFAMNMIFPSR